MSSAPWVPSLARAETPSDVDTAQASAAEREYQDAIDHAVDEYERGHYEEAREHFRRAHELSPSARTLRGLGKVEFELRNYGDSVKHLTAALASDTRPLNTELRREVQSLLDRGLAYVGEVHVDVRPGSATVSVDGLTVASGPKASLKLLVGDHVLEFQASGHLPERRQVHVRGREQIDLSVTLATPEPTPQTLTLTPVPAPPRRDDAKPSGKKWWLWTGAAVLATGAIVTAAVLVARDGSAKPPASSTGVLLESP